MDLSFIYWTLVITKREFDKSEFAIYQRRHLMRKRMNQALFIDSPVIYKTLKDQFMITDIP